MHVAVMNSKDLKEEALFEGCWRCHLVLNLIRGKYLERPATEIPSGNIL